VKVILHVRVPGKPYAQMRPRVVTHGSRTFAYDPSAEDKAFFRKQLLQVCPTLHPDLDSRLGIKLGVWTQSQTEDADNYLKFYMDVLSPPKLPPRQKGMTTKQFQEYRRGMLRDTFAAWGNDRQVDRLEVNVERGKLIDQAVEILVYVRE
jgi:hypothetical protein